MIEEYITLLESFKEHQISKLIESVNTTLLNALNSPKFNRRLAVYLEKRNKTGVPFTDFAQEPDSVSQIKKLINALYHARLAFLDLENLDIRNRSLSDLKLLYSNTIHQAYQASFLLTHLDVDLRSIFNDELKLLAPLFTKFQSISQQVSDQTNKITEDIRNYPISYTAGFVTGTAVTQMQPQSGDIDYDSLTHFGAVLPGYIDQFTQSLSQYSSQLIEKEPTLNKEKLLELQNEAYKLLTNLDNLKTKSFFAPLKILNYIHIVRHIITLSMSTLEQVGNLSDSSQDLIRGYLTELKYDILPTLFGLVDKIEDNAMLKPGTLSIPLMQKINPLYELLIFYASKPVNFAAKGEELLRIEDSRFLSLRLERTYKRIDEANKALFKNQMAQLALNAFFDIIDNPRYKEYTLAQLPIDVKKALIDHYKIIRPYMDKVDVDLNNTIIDGLNSPESWSAYITSYALMPTRWAIGKQTGHLSFIRDKRASLEELISKDRETQLFHIKLNEDLIESVQKQSNLTLLPYHGENPFIIDELKAFNPDRGDIKGLAFAKCADGTNLLLINEIAKLNSEQALDLSQWYRNKHNKLMKAKDAYRQFVRLLNQQNKPTTNAPTFNQLDKEVLAECRNLYSIFQAYFTCGVSPDKKEDAFAIDNYLCHFFSGKQTNTSDLPINILQQFDTHFQNYFTQIDKNWNAESRQYLQRAQEQYIAENKQTVLSKNTITEQREHHLIQHTNYSKFVKEFRANLYPLTSLLNKSMRAQLVAKTCGIPFPELEDQHFILAQPKQVIAFKRIFNSLYHVEGILLALEKLNNKQTESRYVYHLLEAYGHINEIMKLTKDIYADPHSKLIGQQLLNKAQTLFAQIQEHSDAYQVSQNNVLQTETVQNNGLWYGLNALHIIPVHISTICNGNDVTTKQMDELHRNAKRAASQIESIVNNSNDYFKLFLQTPKMFELYGNLTKKLAEFTSTTHDTVISNLDHIKTGVFTPMLIEADRWEDELGLEPGLLSGPMKQLTDEYFKGFLKSLDLSSKKHIELFCNNSSLDARKKVSENKIAEAKKQIEETDKKYESISFLYKALEDYFKVTNEILPGTDQEIDQQIEKAKTKLKAQFKEALPMLVQLDQKVSHDFINSEYNIDLDDLLNKSTNDYDRKFKNIKALIIGSYCYYFGERATFEMQRKTSEEKLEYLNALGDKQKDENLIFIHQYVEASFDKQMEDYCNRHLGLQAVHTEYRTHLREYLLTQKKNITQLSKSSDDIDLTISNLLEEKIKVFEKDNFAHYYHLDTIRIALAQFTLYFSTANTAISNKNSVFESKDTLAKKAKLINELENIASTGQLSIQEFIKKYKASSETMQNNKNASLQKTLEEQKKILQELQKYKDKKHLTIEELISHVKHNTTNSQEQTLDIRNLSELKEKIGLSVEERIDFIKSKVNLDESKGILLAHKNPHVLSMNYLKQCFFSLMEALYLRTPTRKKLYENLKDTVNTTHQISDLTTRFGLFSTPPNKSKSKPPALAPTAVLA